MKIGPAYSVRKTVLQDICGPDERLVLISHQHHAINLTQIFHQNLLFSHDITVLRNQCLAILQDLLLHRVADTDAIGIFSRDSGNLNLNIIHCCDGGDFDRGRKLEAFAS